jgi:hypothetical protein
MKIFNFVGGIADVMLLGAALQLIIFTVALIIIVNLMT